MTADNGTAVRTPLAADSPNAFLQSVQEGVRRDRLRAAAGDLDAALHDARGYGGLTVDPWGDHAIEVGIARAATADERARLRAIVSRFPALARDVGYVTLPAASADLEQLQRQVLQAWDSAPGFISVGQGFGRIDLVYLAGHRPPAAVQAIIDRHPGVVTVEQSATMPVAD